MSGTSSNNTPVNNNASAAPEASLAALPLTTALMPTFGLHKSMDEDELRLRKLGYTQTLHRGLSAFDNFAVT